MKKKLVKDHETQWVPEVNADIDIPLVPVIKFLNEIPHVRTVYCCQGGPPFPGLYISFRLEVLEAIPDVMAFFERVEGAGKIELAYDVLRGMTFTFRPHVHGGAADKHALDALIQNVKRYKGL